MQDAIHEAMFEFAMTCKYLMKRGWEFVEINYGERRLGVGPRFTMRRGTETKTVSSPAEMEDLLNEEVYEEDRKKWSSE